MLTVEGHKNTYWANTEKLVNPGIKCSIEWLLAVIKSIMND